MDPSKAPIAIADIKKHYPAWPFSVWHTWKLARDGSMPTIRIGRRYFATLELIERFLAMHTSARPKRATPKRATKTTEAA